jgi:hypothetical protein
MRGERERISRAAFSLRLAQRKVRAAERHRGTQAQRRQVPDLPTPLWDQVTRAVVQWWSMHDEQRFPSAAGLPVECARSARDGRRPVSYAVLSFGGFLGIGDDYYPLPWPSLKYDTQLGGYRTNVTSEKLKGASKYSKSQTWDWEDQARGRQVYGYYDMPWPY